MTASVPFVTQLIARFHAMSYAVVPESRGKRDLRVDLLRGFCVFVMIVDHVGGETSWLYGLTGGNHFFVSAAEGWELADIGGRDHRGGGSHGSLLAGDSIVPMLALGLEGAGLSPRPGIAELVPAALAHFGLPGSHAPDAVLAARA